MATGNIYLLNMPLGWERQLWIMVAVYFAKVCDQQVPPMDAIVDNNVGLRWLLVFSCVISLVNLVDFILLSSLNRSVMLCLRSLVSWTCGII